MKMPVNEPKPRALIRRIYSMDADDELEQNLPLSEGAVDIPDGSVVGIESSNGLGIGLEVESDGDHKDD